MIIELNEINGKPEIKITGETEEIATFCDNLLAEGYSVYVEKVLTKSTSPIFK